MTLGSKDIKKIYDNIYELNSRQSITIEQKKIFCEILAQLIVDSNADPEALRATLFDHASEMHDGSNDDIMDLFCSAIKKSNFSLKELLTGALLYDEFSPLASANIVYVKNNYSDSAFVKFSNLFKSPKVSYKHTFDEVCESVYNGSGDYCILPIENASGGKLFTFYSLIDKYELKIFAVCDIYETNSDHSTRYALITRKNIAYAEKETLSMIEFSIIPDGGYELGDILNAAAKCGLTLSRIDTTSASDDDSSFRYYHIFEGIGKGIVCFLLYLTFKYPQYKSIGYYISL